MHLNFTAADNKVGVTAAAPVQLLDLNWADSFTNPQIADNKLSMVSLNGEVKATPTLTFSGITYYRWFQQKHIDGNIVDADGCNGPPDIVCFENDAGGFDPVVGPGGRTEIFDPDASYGTLDHTSQNANSWGLSGHGVEKARVFGHPNQFLLGASYDHGRVGYASSSDLGTFGPNFTVNPIDPSFLILEPDDFEPRNLTTQNDYVGVYFSDTIDLTPALAFTVGGRYNFARLTIQDNTGTAPEVDGDHVYERFNPMTGFTYQFHSGLTLYGSYAEANRAPTPAELACSDPNNPCLIESFLTADPNLQQVVSRTFELGLRGKETYWNDGRLEWTAGLFHAMNYNDILALAAPQTGRGVFQNVGDTLPPGCRARHALHRPAANGLCELRLRFGHHRDGCEQLPSPDNPNGAYRATTLPTPPARPRPRATGCRAYLSTASRPASTTGSRTNGSSAATCSSPAIKSSTATGPTTTPRSRAMRPSTCTLPTTSPTTSRSTA